MAQYHLQLLRGNATKAGNYTGKVGEIICETGTTPHLRVHDGTQRGGYRVANISDIPTKISAFTNDANYVSSTGGNNVAPRATADAAGNVISTYYAPNSGATLIGPTLKSGSVNGTTKPVTINGNLTGSGGTWTVSSTANFSGAVNFTGAAGTVKAPTVAATDNSTNVATTAWVLSSKGVVHTTGDETINGTKTFTSVISGTASKANWADLAENYKADAEYPAGTLVMFGGKEEVTIATDHANAVVSEKPAYLMNNEMVGGTPIALIGRVPVLVDCDVKIGDKLVLGNTPGVATVDNQTTKPLGIALKRSAGGKVLACVQLML